MKILVSGLGGYMGGEVATLALNEFKGASLAGGIDPRGCTSYDVPCFASYDEVKKALSAGSFSFDAIIDFSHHDGTKELLDFATANKKPLVLATTGQTDEEREMIAAASKEIPLFFASNYSMGVALLVELAKKAATAFPEADIEIVETHHNRKVDAPSGTALTLAEEISKARGGAKITTGRSGQGARQAGEIGVQAVRRGNIVGIHDVILSTNNQTITLSHEAHSRALFAEGALSAVAWLVDKKPGIYDMKDIIKF